MPTASDLITYIGVPLTIVGLLPIVYNVVATLLHVHKINRSLRRHGITATIHSDIFNRIVEIELPKFFIQPLGQSSVDLATDNPTIASNDGILLRFVSSTPPASREGDIPSSPEQSHILGSTRSFLEWETSQIGSQTQRTQPGDKLRQPQARIRFWDLILRLCQLGARVTVYEKGWPVLYNNPLQARGHRLMTLDDRQESSLTLQVASYSDSDDPMSLEFERTGPRREWSSLQSGGSARYMVGWISLPCYAHQDEKIQETDDGLATKADSIDCHVTNVGLVHAGRFNIEHLRIKDGIGNEGDWFASCAMVLYAQGPTPILDYRIPTNIRRLAKPEIIPEGVIGVIYGMGVEKIPPIITRRYLSGRQYLNEERDKQEQINGRTQRETEMRRELDAELKDYINRIEKLLFTPRHKGPELQKLSIDWLNRQGHTHIPNVNSATEAVRAILSRMVTDRDFSKSLGHMLDLWCEWARRGAMNVVDFCSINQERATFAQASLVIVALSELDNGVNGPAAAVTSMQECAAKWELVELG